MCAAAAAHTLASNGVVNATLCRSLIAAGILCNSTWADICPISEPLPNTFGQKTVRGMCPDQCGKYNTGPLPLCNYGPFAVEDALVECTDDVVAAPGDDDDVVESDDQASSDAVNGTNLSDDNNTAADGRSSSKSDAAAMTAGVVLLVLAALVVGFGVRRRLQNAAMITEASNGGGGGPPVFNHAVQTAGMYLTPVSLSERTTSDNTYLTPVSLSERTTSESAYLTPVIRNSSSNKGAAAGGWVGRSAEPELLYATPGEGTYDLPAGDDQPPAYLVPGAGADSDAEYSSPAGSGLDARYVSLGEYEDVPATIGQRDGDSGFYTVPGVVGAHHSALVRHPAPSHHSALVRHPAPSRHSALVRHLPLPVTAHWYVTRPFPPRRTGTSPTPSRHRRYGCEFPTHSRARARTLKRLVGGNIRSRKGRDSACVFSVWLLGRRSC
jgi:hypothetical protein